MNFNISKVISQIIPQGKEQKAATQVQQQISEVNARSAAQQSQAVSSATSSLVFWGVSAIGLLFLARLFR